MRMKNLIVLLASAVMAAGLLQPAGAQAPAAPAPDPNAPVYVVGYIDIMPAQKNAAIAVFRQYIPACRREDGNQRCEIVQRMEQQNEFAILQVWRDQKAYQTHLAGPAAQMRDRVKPMLASPYDQRPQTGLAVLPPAPPPPGRVVYAIAHVDVLPARADEFAGMMRQFADGARKEPGNGRFEVLRQYAPRLNHFTLIEIWSNKRTLEAHQVQPATIQFRERLQPALGGLYDERLYKVLD
jgi:quinol monooxygenase YgiN